MPYGDEYLPDFVGPSVLADGGRASKESTVGADARSLLSLFALGGASSGVPKVPLSVMESRFMRSPGDSADLPPLLFLFADEIIVRSIEPNPSPANPPKYLDFDEFDRDSLPALVPLAIVQRNLVGSLRRTSAKRAHAHYLHRMPFLNILNNVDTDETGIRKANNGY